MPVLLEVIVEGVPDGEIAVVGSDAMLGAWDVARAVNLKSSQEAPSLWSGEIPVPEMESEFKLVMLQNGAAASWEPLTANRRFPSRCEDGCTLKMSYGQPRIAIEVSAELHERNAKVTRRMEERVGSALQANIDRKGENAYYHAHTRHYEVPEHAKVISGPGLITGGQPVLLEAGLAADSPEEERVVWLKDYSWSDSTGKVKVYVPVPEGLLPVDSTDGMVEANFAPHQLDLTINCKPRRRLKIEKLNAEVNPDSCITRVEAHKNRIVLQLAKKRETAWYNLTKK
jgi:hypothetical protein